MSNILPRCLGVAVTLLVLSASGAKAQPLIMLVLGDKIAAPNFVGGINGGLGYTTLNDYSGSTYRLSWMFGTYLNWRLSEHWHFAPEITFKTPTGTNGMQDLWGDEPAFDTAVSDRKEWTALSYFSIPLLARYTNGHFGVFGGPQVGYMMEATDNLSGTGPNGEQVTLEKSAFGRMNRWDAGILVGVEYMTAPALGIHSLRIGLRYYHGFLDAVANVSGTQTNSGFYTTVGIPIGGAPEHPEDTLGGTP